MSLAIAANPVAFSVLIPLNTDHKLIDSASSNAATALRTILKELIVCFEFHRALVHLFAPHHKPVVADVVHRTPLLPTTVHCPPTTALHFLCLTCG